MPIRNGAQVIAQELIIQGLAVRLDSMERAERERESKVSSELSACSAQLSLLNAALEQLLDWGVENIAVYARRLTSLADEALVPLGFRVEDDAFRAPHLFGVGLPGELDPQTVASQLKQAGISVSVRGASIRVSAHVYNRQEDLLALRNALSACATPTN